MSKFYEDTVFPKPKTSVKTWKHQKAVKKVETHGYTFGVCLEDDGSFILSVMLESGEREIQMFDKNYCFTKSFILKKGAKYFDAFQITLTKTNSIAAACKNCVTVWSKEGKLLMDHGKNMFKCAKFLGCRSNDEIVVSDTDDNCVRIISPNSITKLDFTFKTPTGVAVDSKDNFAVADWSNRVRIFDEGNNLVRVIGTKDQLDCPYGLVYDGTDHLIIADMWNDRVSVYSCGEEGKAEGHVLGGERAKLKFTRPAFVSVTNAEASGCFRLLVSDFTAGFVSLYVF